MLARAQLFDTAPGWVIDAYSAFGQPPDVVLHFDQGRAWYRGLGEDIPDKFLTISRASTAYQDDNSGNWTSFGNNILRRTPKGALVEEARTNIVTNNSMQGAAAGSPGTYPTGWQVGSLAGITTSVVGVGTLANGIDYIDLRFNGTATGNIFPGTGNPNGNAGSVTPGDVRTVSAWMALVGGSMTNVTAIYVAENYNVSGSNSVEIHSTISSTLTRFTGTNTVPASNTTVGALFWNIGLAGAVDFTLRIGWPQQELGAFATSPIRTTSAAVTRAADNVTVANLPLMGSEWTLFWNGTVEGPPTSVADFARVIDASGSNNGTDTSGIYFYSTASSWNAAATVAATDYSANSSGTFTDIIGTLVKAAARFRTNDSNFAVNGGIGVHQTVISLPAVTSIGIARNVRFQTYGDCYTKRAAIWANFGHSDEALGLLTT